VPRAWQRVQCPTPEDRARHLLAAHDATDDAEQRLLLGEIMAHFRAWCLARQLADPFAQLAPAVTVTRGVIAADAPSPRPRDLLLARATTADAPRAAVVPLAAPSRAAG
jgi:hypothetical protein